jgi:hypothetical protein
VNSSSDWDGCGRLVLDVDQTLNCFPAYLRLSHNMASKLPSVLSATEEEIQLLLAAQCHIGTKNCDKQMESYVWKRRADGACVLKRENAHFGLNLVQVSTF